MKNIHDITTKLQYKKSIWPFIRDSFILYSLLKSYLLWPVDTIIGQNSKYPVNARLREYRRAVHKSTFESTKNGTRSAVILSK